MFLPPLIFKKQQKEQRTVSPQNNDLFSFAQSIFSRTGKLELSSVHVKNQKTL